MKDIDFDELDKAVSSVMQTTQQVDEQLTSVPVETTVATDEPQAQPVVDGGAPATPSDVLDTPDERSLDAPADTSQPAPAVKRSGRFMDVMHPSSDMKTAAVSPPSREGVAIEPPVEVAAVSADQGAEMPELPAATVETAPDVMPDPLDHAPLQSPFLPDAQVEKRPLGGEVPSLSSLNDLLVKELSGDIDDTSTVSTNPVEKTSEPAAEGALSTEAELSVSGDDPDDQLPATPDVAPLPVELHSDIVAIESGEVQPAVETSPPAQAATTPQPVTPAAGSIAQQYAEQPSTSDQSHTPIYDTDIVAQPLAHPPKKKSGWFVVLFIILLLVVCGGGAVGLYFLGYL